MLKIHDLPFAQARTMQIRRFGPGLAGLPDDHPGADLIRRFDHVVTRKGQAVCLYEPGLAMLVASGAMRAEIGEFCREIGDLLRETGAPVRLLLAPEDVAPRLIRAIEAATGSPFAFQRKRRLLYLPDAPAPADPSKTPPGQIRVAMAADVPAAAAMIEKQEGEMMAPEALAAALIQGRRAYVWDDGGPIPSPVAMAALGGEDDDSFDLNTVNTHPQKRGRGYAGALLRALIAHCQPGPKGKRTAIVQVDEDNKPAQALYKSLGFKYACAWRYAEAGAQA